MNTIRNLGVAVALALPALAQTTSEPATTEPTKSDVQLQAARKQKAKASAQQPADKIPAGGGGALKASGGNSWFPVTVRELGTFYGSGEAIGKFEFQNPQATAVDWLALTPSCQCASAEITVGERTYRVISKPQKRVVRVTKRPGQPDLQENVQKITIAPHDQRESGAADDSVSSARCWTAAYHVVCQSHLTLCALFRFRGVDPFPHA